MFLVVDVGALLPEAAISDVFVFVIVVVDDEITFDASIFPVCTPDAISLVSPSFDETTKDVDLSDIVDLLSVTEDVSVPAMLLVVSMVAMVLMGADDDEESVSTIVFVDVEAEFPDILDFKSTDPDDDVCPSISVLPVPVEVVFEMTVVTLEIEDFDGKMAISNLSEFVFVIDEVSEAT
jgi:hypothetical protein